MDETEVSREYGGTEVVIVSVNCAERQSAATAHEMQLTLVEGGRQEQDSLTLR